MTKPLSFVRNRKSKHATFGNRIRACVDKFITNYSLYKEFYIQNPYLAREFMKRKVFKKLLTPEDAYKIFTQVFPPKELKEFEEVNIEDAVNRILFETIESPLNIPHHPRSLVDGYAVKVDDVKAASETKPVTLRVIGYVSVNQEPCVELLHGTTVGVDTGSIVPLGANAVVPVEYVEEYGDYVKVLRSVKFGENIAIPGSDVCIGEIILEKGSLLTPNAIGALASIGIRRVKAYRKLRLCIISTGNELQEPGTELKEAHIYDSNTYALASEAKKLGFEPVIMGIVPDLESELEKTLMRAISLCDVVIISGGSSAGPQDLVYRVLESMGKIIIHGLRIRPGKPTIYAVVNGKPVFGLPGNPISAITVFRLFIYPYIARVAGLKYLVKPIIINTNLKRPIATERGRRIYNPSITLEEKNQYFSIPVASESYMVASFSRANSYVIIDEYEDRTIKVGSTLPTIIYGDTYLYEPECIIVGEFLLEIQECLKNKCSWLYIVIGSRDPEIEVLSEIANAIVIGASTSKSFNEELIANLNIPLVLVENNIKEKFYYDLAIAPYTSILHEIATLQNKNYVITRHSLHAATLVKEGYAKCAIIPKSIADYLGMEYRAMNKSVEFLIFKGKRAIESSCVKLLREVLQLKNS